MTRRIGRSCDFTRHDGFQPGVGFVLSSAQFSLVHILQPHCARFSAARESTYTIYPNEEEYMEITQLNLQPSFPFCLLCGASFMKSAEVSSSAHNRSLP
jgi:hypothetical protein